MNRNSKYDIIAICQLAVSDTILKMIYYVSISQMLHLRIKTFQSSGTCM